MIHKIVIINNCGDCPFFSNEYYSFDEECMKLDRCIKVIDGVFKIPDDCPLETTDKDETA